MPTEALAEASPKPKTFPGRSVNSNIPLSATVTDSPGGFREGGQGTQHTRVILTREAQSRVVQTATPSANERSGRGLPVGSAPLQPSPSDPSHQLCSWRPKARARGTLP